MPLLVALGAPRPGDAHPLGNFSINQYTGIRITRDAVELRYLVDLAEIPTFQEIQDTSIAPEAGHPSLRAYLAGKAETLKEGLRLEVDGRALSLRTEARDVIFPPGAGGLPTMKLGMVYRAALPPTAGAMRLDYRDGNYPDRAGWKEVVAAAGPGASVRSASVPERDRSRELSDYPTDLLNSPPQDREAHVVFSREVGPPAVARAPSQPAGRGEERAVPGGPPPQARSDSPPAASAGQPTTPPAGAPAGGERLALQPNRQGTPRSAFTDLLTRKRLGLGVVAVGLVVAAALGAFHALEPGHGKTVVAAYLVGSRSSARHAVLLGLVVTASHTAGVYALGLVTLYGSRYVMPDRLYPWLGVGSGVVIAALGLALLFRRYAGRAHPHAHGHAHDHGHSHGHGPHDHPHPHRHGGEVEPHEHGAPAGVSTSSVIALGVTGGIVPCPAALVVLLSALSLDRVGLGLLLIVAFSVGLAAVLIAIGMLMVYARRFMARFQTEGRLVQVWLPVFSAAVITVIGVAITVQALMTARF